MRSELMRVATASRIVIVGAGMGRLAAALRLRAQGIVCHHFTLEPHPGVFVRLQKRKRRPDVKA